MKVLFQLMFFFSLISLLLTSCSQNQILLRKPAQVHPFNTIKLPEGVKTLMDHEQGLMNKVVDPGYIHSISENNGLSEFRPESRYWFDLKTIWIPESELNVAEIPESTFHNKNFIKRENGQRYFRLIIHPESEHFYTELMNQYERGTPLLGTPTSSSRTLLITDKEGLFFFGKLSLDIEIGKIIRTIPKGEVARSVGYTKYTDQLESPNKNFQIIREPLGIIPKKFERGGQILREIPYEGFKNKNKLIPFFSLYSREQGETTLLKEMIKRSGEHPLDFVNKKILKPFAQAWVDWAIDGKLVMEAHGQNVLIQLNKEGDPTGTFYHRDLGGFSASLSEINFDGELPYFGTIKDDYHLKSHKKALTQSLHSYFEGGIVYNIEIELEKLGYTEINLKREFRQIIIDELKLHSKNNFKRLSPETLYSNIVIHIQKIRKEKNSFQQNCLNFVRKIFY